jgi:hypothetical protein
VTFSLNGNLNDAYWELGDGATAEGSSVNHTYQKPGFYRVVMGSKVGDIFKEQSSAIVRVHTPETLHKYIRVIRKYGAFQDLSTHEAYTALVTGQFRGDDVAYNGKLVASKSLVRTACAGTIVPLDEPVLAGKPVTFKLSGNPVSPLAEIAYVLLPV